MKPARKKKGVPAAEAIARLADRGQDVSRHFTNRGRMMQPIQRVNVDFTAEMLQDLDQAASKLNVSRQAVIKVFLRQALDQHYLAQKARRSAEARRGQHQGGLSVP
ncbi:MAG: hypothetical protein FJW34_22395 [Acidobacteria bacterium]|nr:hypothetical protein [Acidobacteriota bacterium]